MKLTDEKRLRIYRIVRGRLKSDIHLNLQFGLCYHLRYASKKIIGAKFYIEDFPELIKHKPNDSTGVHWFNLDEYGHKKRLEIVEQAIDELTEKISKQKNL
jgi:hypothetical protein